MNRTAVTPHRPPLRSLVQPFVEPTTWHTASYSLCNLPLGVIAFLTTFVVLTVAVSLLVTVVLGVAVLAVYVPAAFLGARVERARAAAFLGERITPAPRAARPTASYLRRLWADLRSGTFWKTVAYLLLLLPVGVLTFGLTFGLFSSALALLLAPAFVPALPEESLDFWFATADTWPELVVTGLAGAVLLLAAVWAMRAVRRLELAFVRTFLGTSLAEEVTTLEARVGALAETRARVVDAAEVERRRIERDLHDGTQQRLVSLAMQLGMAKEKLATDPDAARALIEDAHRDAKQTLVELRDIVRGIHPPLLTERGLTAAVESLAARAGFEVVVDSHLDRRLTDSIESAAYFVISECLANVAKHAPGASAWVLIRCEEDPLRPGTGSLAVEVGDNGPGGAVGRPGGGLAGLRTRVVAVDGALHVTSPPGGPTTVVARMPCAAREG